MTETTPATLTDKEFWESEYSWAGAKPPVRIDRDDLFDRGMAAQLTAHAPVDAGATVFEIGCAPAKWLAFYAETFGAAVTGVEYTAPGAELSRANLAACGIDGVIWQDDFFAMDPEPFDLVLSFGFIEHFDDLDAVFARHVDFIAPGGRMALGVPNFRGLNRAVQRLADPGYLALHNLDAMQPERYRTLAQRHGLQLERLHYVGGFAPGLIRLARGGSVLHPRRAVPAAITLAGRKLRGATRGDDVNSRWFSSQLLGFYRRPT